MERKYYFSDGKGRVGPLTLDELNNKRVTPNMLFWYNGLSAWKKGYELPELASVFNGPQAIVKVQPTEHTSEYYSKKFPRQTKNTSLWLIVGVLSLPSWLLLLCGHPPKMVH